MLVLAAITAYISYMPVERATQVVQRQVAAGEPPHASSELATRLNAVQAWSPYADFAETIGLMVSVPNEKTASGLAARCERAAAFAPARTSLPAARSTCRWPGSRPRFEFR